MGFESPSCGSASLFGGDGSRVLWLWFGDEVLSQESVADITPSYISVVSWDDAHEVPVIILVVDLVVLSLVLMLFSGQYVNAKR